MNPEGYFLSKPFATHSAYDPDTSKYTTTPRPQARVKPEAQDIEFKNRGSIDFGWSGFTPPTGRDNGTMPQDDGSGYRTKQLLYNYGRNEPTPRPPPAEQGDGTGYRTKQMLYNYGKNRVTPRPVKSTGDGDVARKLLYDARSLPVTARPGPRIKPEAQKFAQKNRGSLAATGL